LPAEAEAPAPEVGSSGTIALSFPLSEKLGDTIDRYKLLEQIGELTTTAKHHQTDSPQLVHLARGDLDWIAMKCLEKDRTRPYDTAHGLALDLPPSPEQRAGAGPTAEQCLSLPENGAAQQAGLRRRHRWAIDHRK
jgi:hypothetical protein